MREPVVRRGDPGIAHTRGGTHHLDNLINNLCWGTFCRTEERRQVKADVHDTLLESFGAPLPEGRGHVKLCPLRRRSRGERAPVKLGALCRRSRREREGN